MCRHSLIPLPLLASLVFAGVLGKLIQPVAAAAGINDGVTLPMHAVIGLAGCFIDDPCTPGPPQVNVPANTLITAYLLVRNHDEVAGVQTAFEWADWSYHGADWMCQEHQLVAVTPSGNGGPLDGSLATAFDCVLGPATAVIGAMAFTTGQTGCLIQVESAFPDGTHVISCNPPVPEPVGPAGRGAICVGSGGVNACTALPSTPPVCNAGGPYLGPTGFPIELDGSNSFDPDGAIVSYDWEFGDGAQGTGPTPTHTYTSAGVYTATLCVTDDDGQQSCCGATVTMSDDDFPPVCDPGGPYTQVQAQVVIFDGSDSYDPDGTVVSHAWQFGDGATGTGAITSHAYATPGTYAVTLCVTDDEGYESCCGTTATVNEVPPSNNAGVGFVLHAIPNIPFGPCQPPVPPCPNPTTQVDVGDQVVVYFVVDNVANLAGVQTAFDFGPFAFQFGLWDCQSNQLGAITPTAPGGPTSGTIATAFDCITGTGSVVIGRMHFLAEGVGCITQPQSTFPNGNHIVDCEANPTIVAAPECLGSVCAGAMGVNACGPCGIIAVESTTWGALKARYRQ